MRNFKITVSGNTYDVMVEEVGESAVSSAPIAATPVQQAEVKAPVSAPVGGTKVTSPMPGTIMNIVAQNGSVVKTGDVIVVLEAMKMENDIIAPCDGKVTVTVAKGATVASGDILATIN